MCGVRWYSGSREALDPAAERVGEGQHARLPRRDHRAAEVREDRILCPVFFMTDRF